MALKDIFKMIKADRYTADGCEEIKKAQDAIKEETADAGLPDGTMRHRKDGDYIKQAGKWVPAKRANGGAKKAEGDKPSAPTQKKEVKPAAGGWEETRMASGKIYDLKSRGKRIIEQYDPETETKTFKLRDLNNSRTPDKEFKSLEEAKTAATKSAENKPAKKKSQFDEWEEEVRQNKASLDKQAAKVTKVLSTPADKALYKDIYSFADDEHTDFKSALYTIAEGVAEDAKEKGRDKDKDAAIIKMARALGVANDLKSFIRDEHDYKFASDSAPRQLTGDCKVRIRKG